jgi:hypothetical protein
LTRDELTASVGISIFYCRFTTKEAVRTSARILLLVLTFAFANVALGLLTFSFYRERACRRATLWAQTAMVERGEAPRAVSCDWTLGLIELETVTAHAKHYAAMVDRNNPLLLATPLNLLMEPNLELRQFWTYSESGSR